MILPVGLGSSTDRVNGHVMDRLAVITIALVNTIISREIETAIIKNGVPINILIGLVSNFVAERQPRRDLTSARYA